MNKDTDKCPKCGSQRTKSLAWRCGSEYVGSKFTQHPTCKRYEEHGFFELVSHGNMAALQLVAYSKKIAEISNANANTEQVADELIKRAINMLDGAE